MRLRKIGDYQLKGSVGVYLEGVDIPRTQPRYAAVDWAGLPDDLFPAMRRGEVLDLALPVALFPRVDLCL